MVTTANGNAPPASERHPAPALDLEQALPSSTSRADHEGYRRDSPARQGAMPQLRLLPRVEFIWAAALFLSVWALLVVPDGSTAAGMIGLFAASAFAWTIQSVRARRGAVTVASGFAFAVLISIGGLGMAAFLAGTAINPILLALPIVVGILGIVAGRTLQGEAGLAIALVSIAGVAMRSIFGLDEPTAATLFLAGAAAAMSVAAFEIGRRGLLGEFPAARLLMTSSTARSALQPIVRERLASADDPKTLAIIAADALLDCGEPAYVSINELLPDSGILMPIVERGTLDLDAEPLRKGLSALTHEAINDGGERWLVDDGKDLDAITCRRLGVKALLIVPLQRLSRGVGAIHIAWTELDDPLTLGLALAQASELAEWITPDLTIARVAGEIERGYISAMASVSASLDDRDVHTRGHSRRVAKIALEIAELMDLSEHEQRQLVYAAEMHDLGKVGVSDRILGKPGALTDDEWSAVRAIPSLGANIVEPVSFFGDVHEAIRHLRERWDGGGYPDGCPGTQIPILARILAVADAYDAMTSPRPYREAMSKPDALRQLWSERARAYDPDVVEVFVMSQAPGRSS